MSNVTLQLPDSLHKSIQALVEREGYSIDQILASTAAEKMAALQTLTTSAMKRPVAAVRILKSIWRPCPRANRSRPIACPGKELRGCP
jgi:hypothetical protein